MPTKRSCRKRKRRAQSLASPALLEMLASPVDPDTTVLLAHVLADPLFRELHADDEGDGAKGVDILSQLWSLYAERAAELCVQKSPGCRPAFWWRGRQRPFVKQRDWNVDGDRERQDRERREADLKFLYADGHLTGEEKAALARAGGSVP